MTPATADPDTLADVLKRLGDVPPDRILWTPRPGTATEADVVRFVDGDRKRLVELVDGVLVEKAMGYWEGVLAQWIGTCLNNFVIPRRLGIVGGADSMMRLFPGLVRLPDVSFKAHAAIPSRAEVKRAVARFGPDLAVEVVSRKNTRREIDRKRREYFAAGTRLMWVVHPRTETVQVYTTVDAITVLTNADTLDGGDLLPGFQLAVADIFNYPEPPAGPPSTKKRPKTGS